MTELEPDCDCNICRTPQPTTPRLGQQLRVDAAELALADARLEIGRLEHDLAVAVDLAFRRGRVLRALKPLVGVPEQP